MFPLVALLALSAPVPAARPVKPPEVTPGEYEWVIGSTTYRIRLNSGGGYSCGTVWTGVWGWHPPTRTLFIQETSSGEVFTDYVLRLDGGLCAPGNSFRRLRRLR